MDWVVGDLAEYEYINARGGFKVRHGLPASVLMGPLLFHVFALAVWLGCGGTHL